MAEDEEEREEWTRQKAFHAIHQEAVKLLEREDLPEIVRAKIELIASLSRYQSDVRSDTDKLF